MAVARLRPRPNRPNRSWPHCWLVTSRRSGGNPHEVLGGYLDSATVRDGSRPLEEPGGQPRSIGDPVARQGAGRPAGTGTFWVRRVLGPATMSTGATCRPAA